MEFKQILLISLPMLKVEPTKKEALFYYKRKMQVDLVKKYGDLFPEDKPLIFSSETMDPDDYTNAPYSEVDLYLIKRLRELDQIQLTVLIKIKD